MGGDSAISKKDLVVFSIIWGFIFLIVGLYPALSLSNWATLDVQLVRPWALAVSIMFFLFSWLRPRLLVWLYRFWVLVGEKIGSIISRVILVALFYFLFTPIALVLKVLNKDLLRKKIVKSKTSYWIHRAQQPGSMKNQY